MHLEREDYFYYLALKKGYEGELKFDTYTAMLKCHCLILNALQLEVGRSSFQIDALLLSADKIFIYEVKNFEGVHYWGKEKFTKETGSGMENPTLQLVKAKVRLELLLQKLGCHLPVEARVIYINPEFTLLNAPDDEPFLLLSQLPAHLRAVQKTARLSPALAEWAADLARLHDPDYMGSEPPAYSFQKLRKGMACPDCLGLMTLYRGHNPLCRRCGKKRAFKVTLEKAVEDFSLLFPEEKITTNRIAEWCGIKNRDRVYRILKAKYQPVGQGQGRYYIKKEGCY